MEVTVGPLVSIITPTFNRAPLLAKTINSIRRQTYSNIEHVVRDGASTDGTVELLQSLEGQYPLRWTSRPDSGMYSAINAGLAEARGSILGYLNSDDLYFPWTVEVVAHQFEEHPEVDFIYGDAIAIDEATGTLRPYWLTPFDLDYIRRSGFLAQPTVFWRKSAFDALGPFDETLQYVADCDYWMRAGAAHRFLKVDEFLAIERNHGETLRESIGAPLWAELERVRARYVSLTGNDHVERVKSQDRRRNQFERSYKLGLLVQALVPAPVRRGRWSRLLNSRMVKIERLRYLLRASRIGKSMPGLRDFAEGELFRADRSLLSPLPPE